MNPLVAGGSKHVACPKRNVADIHLDGFQNPLDLEVALGTQDKPDVVPLVTPEMATRIDMVSFQMLGALTFGTFHFRCGLMFAVTFVAKYVATRSDTKMNSAVPTTRCSAIFFIFKGLLQLNYTPVKENYPVMRRVVFWISEQKMRLGRMIGETSPVELYH